MRESPCAAHARTGIAAADFSRIRNADLGRFTLDRLMSTLNRLGTRIEVKIRVHRAETPARDAALSGATAPCRLRSRADPNVGWG